MKLETSPTKTKKTKTNTSKKDRVSANKQTSRGKDGKKGEKKSVRKTKEKRSFFYYAWPPNLKAEIGALGYSFGTKDMLGIYGGVIGVMFVLGYLFKLSLIWMVPLFIAGLLLSPKMVRNSFKNRWEGKRFSDVNVYVEQMLYSFKGSQKILVSLKEVVILFPKGGAMYEVIANAIDLIETAPVSEDTADIEADALGLIEARYPSQYIRSLHRFLLKVEGIGGNFDTSIDLLLANRNMWENRTHKLQAKRKRKKSEIFGSCVASIGLCLALLYIQPNDISIADLLPVRIANVVMIITMVWIYLKGDTKLASNLIEPHKEQSEAKVRSSYHNYVTYDPKKGLRSSLKFAIFPVALCLIGLLLKSKWVIVIGVLLLPLMLTQHIWGHALLGRRLRRSISIAFPQWLMELALLLQSDNVQVSIFKTVDEALPIMKPELEKLRDALMVNPADPDPYLEFFDAFDMPEVTTAMQKLQSLDSGTGNAETQIASIVERNNIILDRAEDMANDDSMASLYGIFLAPLLVSSVVMMVNMTCLLVTFSSQIIT